MATVWFAYVKGIENVLTLRLRNMRYLYTANFPETINLNRNDDEANWCSRTKAQTVKTNAVHGSAKSAWKNTKPQKSNRMLNDFRLTAHSC